MSRRIRVVRTLPALRRVIARYRGTSHSIALVPTMGALHPGHIALIRAAKRRAKRVIVSIFVNPAQFAPGEDFATYPRTWAADMALLEAEDVDVVWAPRLEAMYPPGFSTRIIPEGPATAGLEDKFRPHFFAGVATVVAKLFLQCQPDIALFGEKDFQQLKVVTRMAKDLALPIRVVGIPTVREKDGLALSSRNAYLNAAQRAVSPLLYRCLRASAKDIRRGKSLATVLTQARRTIRKAGFELDYFEARDAETLRPVRSARNARARLLVAARLGKTRLIDNIGV